MARLVPNEESDPLPEDLYAELEAQEVYGYDDQVYAILENSPFDEEDAEIILRDYRTDW